MACGGTGKSSKGGECHPCRGTGYKIQKPVEDEPKNKCPYNHQFGHDCENTDDCPDCMVWSDCFDLQEELASKKKKKKSKK